MSEKKMLIEGKRLEYSGLFRVDEFYGLVKRFMRERGWWLVEKHAQEDIFEHGKQIVYQWEPFKKYSDYAKGEMLLRFQVRNLKERTVMVDGHKQKYEQGELSLTFYVFLVTDWRSKWEKSGFQFLVRTLMNKFVRHDYSQQLEDMTVKDANDLAEDLKRYLNMTRAKLQPRSEEKVADFA